MPLSQPQVWFPPYVGNPKPPSCHTYSHSPPVCDCLQGWPRGNVYFRTAKLWAGHYRVLAEDQGFDSDYRSLWQSTMCRPDSHVPHCEPTDRPQKEKDCGNTDRYYQQHRFKKSLIHPYTFSILFDKMPPLCLRVTRDLSLVAFQGSLECLQEWKEFLLTSFQKANFFFLFFCGGNQKLLPKRSLCEEPHPVASFLLHPAGFLIKILGFYFGLYWLAANSLSHVAVVKPISQWNFKCCVVQMCLFKPKCSCASRR